MFKSAMYALVIVLSVISFAFAEEKLDPKTEIVYRASLGRADDVRLLLKQGADANTKNEKGVPLLSLATTRKDGEEIDVMQALLAGGADINGKDSAGQTALFYAAREGNKTIVELLLNKGIDYYAPDKEGNIARTVAHNAGHDDIVQMMDRFVTDQSKKVSEDYKKYNEAIAARDHPVVVPPKPEPTPKDNAETAKTLDKATKDLEKKTVSEKPVALPDTTYTPSASELAATEAEKRNALIAEETARQKALEAKRESQQFKDDMYELAFHSCSFQYLSFCFQTGQRSDVTFEQLSDGIEVQREDVIQALKKIPEEYEADPDYINRISNGAKQRVQDDMDNMPSKAYIFEHGVCKMADVRTRCKAISNSWRDLEDYADEEESDAEERRPAANQPTYKKPTKQKPLFPKHKK